MIDLSDGLARDLSRLCRASGVGARIALDRVPVADALALGAEHLGVDAIAVAISGGEDYELLATIPADAVATARAELAEAFGVGLTDVGEIVEGSGMRAVSADGQERLMEPAGWDHFADG